MELLTFRNYNSPCTSVLYYFLEGYVRKGVDWLVMTLYTLWGLGRLGRVPFTVTPPEVPLSRVAESSSDAGRGDPCWWLKWIDQTPWKFKSSSLNILYRAPEGFFSSNHPFSGAMLNFGSATVKSPGVCCSRCCFSCQPNLGLDRHGTLHHTATFGSWRLFRISFSV